MCLIDPMDVWQNNRSVILTKCRLSIKGGDITAEIERLISKYQALNTNVNIRYYIRICL